MMRMMMMMINETNEGRLEPKSSCEDYRFASADCEDINN